MPSRISRRPDHLLAALPSLSGLRTLRWETHQPPGPHVAHIWRHDDQDDGPDQRSSLLGLLAPDEIDRSKRLSDHSRRRRFIVGRAVARLVLSRYAPVDPREWRFESSARGKPVLAGPAPSPPLWFNLSHSGPVTICAVTGVGPAIGADIERSSPKIDLHVAEQFFSAAEVGLLRQLPACERSVAFTRLWALKESFAKARADSIDSVLAGTAFGSVAVAGFSGDGVAAASFVEPLFGEPRDWRFALFELADGYVAGLAIRTGSTRPLSYASGVCPNPLC